jgi:hypothetical protein
MLPRLCCPTRDSMKHPFGIPLRVPTPTTVKITWEAGVGTRSSKVIQLGHGRSRQGADNRVLFGPQAEWIRLSGQLVVARGGRCEGLAALSPGAGNRLVTAEPANFAPAGHWKADALGHRIPQQPVGRRARTLGRRGLMRPLDCPSRCTPRKSEGPRGPSARK